MADIISVNAYIIELYCAQMHASSFLFTSNMFWESARNEIFLKWFPNIFSK